MTSPPDARSDLIRVAALCWVLALSWAAATGARAEDSDKPRGYLHLKFRDTNNLTGVHDYFGFALGANLNRFLGVELSGDRFELFPEVQGLGVIGEYGVFALMPQVRARYPLVQNRLVPYVIGGAGIGFTDFNDRKPPAIGLQVKDESTTPVGTLGAGLEYFLADNIALGVEFKYLFAGDQTLTVGGTRHTFNASSPLTSFGLRIHPELRPAPLADARDPVPTRLYLGFRAGVALPIGSELAPGIEATPVPAAIGGELAKLFGASLGLDVGRYLGAEIAVDGYEVSMFVQGIGTIGEYAVYSFVPTLRLRHPLGDGHIVPYGTVGVGLVHAEFNDRKPPGAGVPVDAYSDSVGGAVGAGVEYFVTSNIAFGLESRYLYSPGHTIKIAGQAEHATLQAVSLAIGLRVYLFDTR
jgi:opacity protein-like surface antigen